MSKIIFLYAVLFVIVFQSAGHVKENCQNISNKNKPCILINKTPNTSKYNQNTIIKEIVTKKNFIEKGIVDNSDLFRNIPGIDIFQSGQKGQSSSVFTRGTDSNHTVAVINGIPINDQSVTDGLHDFGQDFLDTFQQVEIYKGANGAHFGPNAIGGAVNYITDVDYVNNFSSGFFINENLARNNSFSGSLYKNTENDWHVNIKGSAIQSETNSAIAKGHEDDGVKNFQTNINATKWFNEFSKLKNTFYSRNTRSEYDGNASDEKGFISDNKIYVIQTELDKSIQDYNSKSTIHHHVYDRKYRNSGYLDEYYSQSTILKNETSFAEINNFSYGLGAELKYDSGEFQNRGSYTANTRGNIKNYAIFTNGGYEFDNNNLSYFIRADSRDELNSRKDKTYKVNFLKKFSNIKFIISQSTGLRYPTLYELHGTDNFGITGNPNLKPEKSKTNELYFEYDQSDDLKLKTTFYQSNVSNLIESNSGYTTYINENDKIYQKGLETQLSYNQNNDFYLFYVNFSDSKKSNGISQSRRPDLTFGMNFDKELKIKKIGIMNLNLDYKYTGEYIDWDGAKNSKQKSLNIFNLTINKSLSQKYFSTIKIGNIFNKSYEKPATYSQNGRTVNIQVTKKF